MTERTLSSFLDLRAAAGAIVRFDHAVDPRSNLAAVGWRCRNELNKGSLFDQITGSPEWRVATQVLGMRDDWQALFGLSRENCLFELRDRARRLVSPCAVKDAGLNAHHSAGPDLAQLPMPVLCAADAGVRSATAVLVLGGGQPLLGLARVQLGEAGRLAFGCEAHEVVQRLRAARVVGWRPRAALVLGAHPSLYLAAAMAASGQQGGYALAGALLGEAIRTCSGEDGLPLPADAECVLEGTIDVAADAALAGLGETTGTLAEPGTGWWFAEETLRHRQDPVFWSLQTGAPIADAGVLQAMATEIIVAEHLRNVEGGLDLIDVRCPAEAGNLIVIVKLRGRVDGQTKTALMAALSSPALLPKLAIGVDEDVDVDDLRDVGWSMASRTHAQTDVSLIDGMWAHPNDLVSPKEPGPGMQDRVGTKWLFDSTMPALTQPSMRAAYERAIPRNLHKIVLDDYLPKDDESPSKRPGQTAN